jgi:phosphate transport system substrate-binding protein
MNSRVVTLLVLLASLAACNRQEAETNPTRGRVTAYVAESHAALLQQEVDEFHRLYEAAHINLLTATTREAIVHLLNDSVRIIIIDRPLNAEEQQVVKDNEIRVNETRIAEDALALIVNKQHPLENLTLATIKDIVRGKITNWRQVPERAVTPDGNSLDGPIEFVFTGRNSGAYELLVQKFLNLQEEVVPAVVVQTQNEVLDYVKGHTRALGVVSAACFYAATRPKGVPDSTTVLRALNVERQDSTTTGKFVMLHQTNIYRGYYPFHYGVYIYTTSSPNRDAGPEVGFATFVASYPGQKIIRDAGLAPATMPIRLVQTNED